MIADRTGSAVRPAPRCSTSLIPVSPATGNGRRPRDVPRGGLRTARAARVRRQLAARAAGHAPHATTPTATPAMPRPSATQSARKPGCGSASAASPTGNSGEAAAAMPAASTAPTTPMIAALARPTAVSCPEVMPSVRWTPKSADSSAVSRASSWPNTSNPTTASTPASSHSTIACRWIDRSVFASCGPYG